MFKVGQEIICINDKPINYEGIAPIKVGGHYIVNENFGIAVTLVNIPNVPNTDGYLAERFAPLEEIGETTFDEIMEEMLVPKSL